LPDHYWHDQKTIHEKVDTTTPQGQRIAAIRQLPSLPQPFTDTHAEAKTPGKEITGTLSEPASPVNASNTLVRANITTPTHEQESTDGSLESTEQQGGSDSVLAIQAAEPQQTLQIAPVVITPQANAASVEEIVPLKQMLEQQKQQLAQQKAENRAMKTELERLELLTPEVQAEKEKHYVLGNGIDFFSSAQHRISTTVIDNHKKLQAELNQKLAQRTQPSHQQENPPAQRKSSVERMQNELFEEHAGTVAPKSFDAP